MNKTTLSVDGSRAQARRRRRLLSDGIRRRGAQTHRPNRPPKLAPTTPPDRPNLAPDVLLLAFFDIEDLDRLAPDELDALRASAADEDDGKLGHSWEVTPPEEYLRRLRLRLTDPPRCDDQRSTRRR